MLDTSLSINTSKLFKREAVFTLNHAASHVIDLSKSVGYYRHINDIRCSAYIK